MCILANIVVTITENLSSVTNFRPIPTVETAPVLDLFQIFRYRFSWFSRPLRLEGDSLLLGLDVELGRLSFVLPGLENGLHVLVLPRNFFSRGFSHYGYICAKWRHLSRE